MAMLAQSDRMNAEMNITPFIDVLLVLLVIFMVSIQTRQVMLAQLAEIQAAGPTLDSHAIVLELRDDGGYAVNQREFTFAELPDVLRRVYANREESILFVKAGRNRTYRELVAAMDVAKGAGVLVLAMAP